MSAAALSIQAVYVICDHQFHLFMLCILRQGPVSSFSNTMVPEFTPSFSLPKWAPNINFGSLLLYVTALPARDHDLDFVRQAHCLFGTLSFRGRRWEKRKRIHSARPRAISALIHIRAASQVIQHKHCH